jgi:hypothetical protein
MRIPSIFFLLIASLLSGVLMYNHSWGINILLLTISLAILWYYNRPGWLDSTNARYSLCATILAAAAIALGYSSYSYPTYIILFLATIGTLCFSSAPLPTNLMHGVYTLLTSHLNLLMDRRERTSTSKAIRVLKVSVVPVFVVCLFFFLYYLGNPAFASLMNKLTPNAPNAFFWFCLWSAVLFFGTFFINENWYGMLWEKGLSDYLRRDHLKKNLKKNKGLYVGIRKENGRALITLGLLNGLIFLVNVTDIFYIAGGNVPDDLTHSEYVHQGIYTLILSLILAITLILFYFRGSLNFFSQAGLTIKLTVIWLIQNSLLAALCAHRNFLYVEEYGLTHKRIGVWVYIILVLAGLFTTYLKITRKYTLWNLVKINSWIAMGLFLTMSFFNWDGMIARYNLYYARKTDFNYLLRLSDQALPVMNEFEEKSWWPEGTVQRLEIRKSAAINGFQNLEWQSMTWADKETLHSLTEVK